MQPAVAPITDAPFAIDGAVPARDPAPACPECRASLAGRFCASCGEAAPVAGQLRLRHLVSEFVEHLTSLDFRVVRTLVALVRRPGSLTCAFVAGRRNRYTRPLALYLLVSGGFFLLSPHLPGRLYDPTAAITGQSPGSPVARHYESIAARHGETLPQMAARVRRSPATSPRTTAALLAPLLTGLVALLLAGRRRLLAEHVLFAIHLQTFLLVYAAATMASFGVVGAAAGRVLRRLGIPDPDTQLMVVFVGILLLSITILLGHVAAALRRVYSLGRLAAAWRTVVLIVAIPLGLVLGRLALVYLAALTNLP